MILFGFVLVVLLGFAVVLWYCLVNLLFDFRGGCFRGVVGGVALPSF